jgi:hypothetical protein
MTGLISGTGVEELSGKLERTWSKSDNIVKQ